LNFAKVTVVTEMDKLLSSINCDFSAVAVYVVLLAEEQILLLAEIECY